MIEFFIPSIGRVRGASVLALIGPLVIGSPSIALTLNCVEVSSSGRTDCTDAGGAASTCASVTCPGGSTLTGGGGACEAGASKIKSLFPVVRTGTVSIMCEKQGVDPEADAICCRLQ
jgi:hypothetical protein